MENISVLAVTDLVIVIMSIMIGMDYTFNTYTSMTLSFGLIGFICNLLGIILPNLSTCQKLRYGYMLVDNPANNNLPVKDINMVPVVTPVVQPPVAQPLIQQPVVQPMDPIYDQNQNQIENPGYDNNDDNIYGAPPVQYQPPTPQDNNYYYNNMTNNYQYPAEKPVYIIIIICQIIIYIQLRNQYILEIRVHNNFIFAISLKYILYSLILIKINIIYYIWNLNK